MNELGVCCTSLAADSTNAVAAPNYKADDKA